MKPLVSLLAGILALAAPLCAQEAQETQVVIDNDQIKVELTKKFEGCRAPAVVRFSNGNVRMPTCSELAITNRSVAPITAWAAVLGTGFPPKHEYIVGLSEDYLPDKPWGTIAPGEPLRLETAGYTRLYFKVAVFSDGSVFGEPEWVERIVQNRRGTYQDTVIALQKLREANEAGTPRGQLVSEFRELDRQEAKQEIVVIRPGDATGSIRILTFHLFTSIIAAKLEGSQTASNEDGLRNDIDQLESLMLEYGRRLLTSKPPITDHPVEPSEPLDSVP